MQVLQRVKEELVGGVRDHPSALRVVQAGALEAIDGTLHLGMLNAETLRQRTEGPARLDAM